VRPPLILAYHVIGTVDRARDPNHLVVTPDAFAAQVGALRRRGYGFVTMAEFEPRPGVCALTFDDGVADEAPDVLRSLGVPGTFYVNPGLLGTEHHAVAGARLMTADELRALEGELGGHTMHHTVLADASFDVAVREMAECKAALEALGASVSSFAYPQCVYSPACPAAAREAGYATAVTCGARGSLAPYELRRVAIDPLDNRLSWFLKSRDLWRRVYDAPPGRAARRVARPFRHGMLR
jgi:peptidoglycan/xylan/chitin deacetylase (PgdA/CDA1 family)